MEGIYWLLASMPIWATALVLWFVTDGMIHLMRDRKEGLGYQVSYSAKFGDAGLVTTVLIAVSLLQREGAEVPEALNAVEKHMLLFLLCVVAGAIVSIKTLGARSGQAADIYHDVFIAPMILFFAITLLPVFWLNARWWEWVALALAVAVWASMVLYDIKTGRMNQRQWLVRHGFAIKGEIPKR